MAEKKKRRKKEGEKKMILKTITGDTGRSGKRVERGKGGLVTGRSGLRGWQGRSP